MICKRARIYRQLGWVLALFLPALAQGRTVWYVDQDSAGGDGSSWSQAFPSLQDALTNTAIAPDDEIWVADGSYSPGPGVGDSFHLVNGVSVLGGFSGTETARTQRNPAMHVTVLDGNNVNHHILQADNLSEGATVDGFTVTRGRARGTSGDGGGLRSEASRLVIANCVFRANHAEFGGAAIILRNNDTADITNCVFFDNEHLGGNGAAGGLYVGAACVATVSNCTFSKNTSNHKYSGIFVHPFDGDLKLINTIVWDNGEEEISLLQGARTRVQFSCVKDGFAGTGNTSKAPAFVDQDAGDLRLLPGSPCIDAGATSAVPAGVTRDLDWRPRVCGDPPAVDMGAYEFPSNCASEERFWEPDGPDGIANTNVGNVGVTSTLTVADKATFSANVDIADSLAVAGDTEIAENLNIQGALSVVGDSQFSGNVGVGVADPEFRVDVAGPLGIRGDGLVGVAGVSESLVGVFGQGPETGFAGLFLGRLAASLKLFVIDHPLDPANKYLVHACVESDEMKNVYDGLVVLDGNGEAWVQVDDWCEALNRDFRYQLTAIGGAAPSLHVADKLQDGAFRIAGGPSGLEVSWQLTGVRKDPWAEAHPLHVEPDKDVHERGRYLHPALWGATAQSRLFPLDPAIEPRRRR